VSPRAPPAASPWAFAAGLCQCAAAVRVCIVYDCLYPYTVGGAERWYRNLAERLAGEGHEVTYLTLHQWERGERPQVGARSADGSASRGSVRVVGAGPRMELYTGDRRRILPPLVFGAGVLWHLLRKGRRYDVVHSASFPYFSLLAAALTRPIWRFELVVDWHEVWSREYWREYLGRAAGAIGYAVQLLCARVPQRAFCFSELHARRLRGEGLRGEVTVLRGQYAGSPEAGGADAAVDAPREPLVVFAGRLIPEKRVLLGVDAVAVAAARVPDLRAVFYGEGPERTRLLAAIDADGVQGIVSAPGFAPGEVVDADLARAMCLLLPSRREGYGKVVVEASARGTPSIVVAAEDNAATELIDEGVNGVVVARPDADAIAEAIVRVKEAGASMRESTARWYERNASRLSLESSLETVLRSYARWPDEEAPTV
jgi:glycosyltransferase involved in cell wall biosynthesis